MSLVEYLTQECAVNVDVKNNMDGIHYILHVMIVVHLVRKSQINVNEKNKQWTDSLILGH